MTSSISGLQDTCTKDSWSRANVWSYQSVDACMAYALWHCTKSSNHQMDHESAMQCGETATTSIGSHIDVAVKRSYRGYQHQV